MRTASLAARTACCTCFVAAAVWSVRAGYADYEARKQTVEATRRAVQWAPDDADYRFRLALLMRDAGVPGATEELRRSLELNPWEARAWIDLGIRLETEQDLREAERCFLHAAEADRLYLPRWTLANFYFRRGNTADFERWAKAAAQMAGADAPALFRLSERLWDDGELIDRLDIRRPEVRASYLSYLLGRERWNIVMPAARRVMDCGRKEDAPLLVNTCDRLLAAGMSGEALEIWNRLAGAHSIPFLPLDPKSGSVITDGHFASTGIAGGFAWKTPAIAGVSASVEDPPPGLRLTFSGSEPEKCQVLSQVMPVDENREYEVKWLYRTAQIERASGLVWRVTDASGHNLLGEGESLSSEDEKWRRLRFRTPSGCRLATLGLWYGRQPGTARIAGYLLVREASVRGVER